MTKALQADVVVVGAGLVGLSAAIAFTQQGKKVVLVDAKKLVIKLKKAWDERVYALTPETENWLKSIGIWAHVDASRVSQINAMHIFDEACEVPLSLRGEDANLPKLGVIIENQNLMHALWQQLNKLDVIVITDAPCQSLDNLQQQVVLGLVNGQKITAKLIVAADGVDSWVCKQANIGVTKKDFHQTAIVANFVTQKHHQHIARQWFRPHDVLALLPLVGKSVSMVWSVSTERAAELLALSGEQLAHNVHEYSKDVLGTLKQVENTQAFVLNQQTALQLIAERVVVVGDAAHQIHPMAGQGVNLGFRDVMQLTLLSTKLNIMQDIGERTFLRQYERARKADIVAMNQLTSGLDSLFASESGALKQARQWVLLQLNDQAAIKKLLIQQVAA
jgi:2-polyprenylphenol 6-hydroxylase